MPIIKTVMNIQYQSYLSNFEQYLENLKLAYIPKK